MALEGLLAKLGPTLVREATPHVMQVVAGFAERFRKDTREIKDAMDAEIASIARAHAGLVTTLDAQTARTEALGEQLAMVDRRIDLLHKLLESISRQMASDSAQVSAQHRSDRRLIVVAVVLSAIASASTVALLVLHR